MKPKKLFILSFVIISILQGCGGGSSGTGIGTNPELKISGQIVSASGEGIDSALVTLQNTGEEAETDEAGAFDIVSEFPGGDATFSIDREGNNTAIVLLKGVSDDNQSLDVSIQYDGATSSAEILDLTLRSKIVRSCSPLFLNTRTIKQTASLPSGFVCTVETEIKSNGTPLNDLTFELQYRACPKTAEWKFLVQGRTGTSGQGVGEVDFTVFNDPEHCVYRIIGPLNQNQGPPLSAQINTLRKQSFDESQSE